MGAIEVYSSATSFRSQEAVDADVPAVSSPKYETCFEEGTREVARRDLSPETEISMLTVEVTPGSAGGPPNVVGTVTSVTTLSAADQQRTLYLESVLISGPRLEAEVGFFSPGSPVAAPLRTELVEKAATRIAQG